MKPSNLPKALIRLAAQREAIRPERERAAKRAMGNAEKGERYLEEVRALADKWKSRRILALMRERNRLPSGAPAAPLLVDAAAALTIAQKADVRVRDVLTGRADEKLRAVRAAAGISARWDSPIYEKLRWWDRKDARQRVRRWFSPERGASQERRDEARSILRSLALAFQEIRGTLPGYTHRARDWEDAKDTYDTWVVSGPDVRLLKLSLADIIGPKRAPRERVISDELWKMKKQLSKARRSRGRGPAGPAVKTEAFWAGTLSTEELAALRGGHLEWETFKRLCPGPARAPDSLRDIPTQDLSEADWAALQEGRVDWSALKDRYRNRSMDAGSKPRG